MAKMMSVDDQPIIVSRIASDSDSETVEPSKLAKSKPRKKMAVETKPKTRSKNPEVGHASGSTSSNSVTTSEMADFKKMYEEMVQLREKVNTLQTQADQRQEQEQEWEQYVGQDGGASNTWPEQEEEEQDHWEEEDGSESIGSLGSMSTSEQFSALRAAGPNKQVNLTSAPITSTANDSVGKPLPFSSFKMPPPPKSTPVETGSTPAVAVATTTETTTPVGGGKATKARREFKLAEDLHEGSLLSELQETYKKVRGPVTGRIVISESMAGAIHFYYGTPLEGTPKHFKTIRDISRHYTGLADVPAARLQIMNEEIKFGEGRKEGESALITCSKGLVAILTAIAPTMDIILRRGSADPELDAQGIHMLNAIKMAVATHSQARLDRKKSVTKVVHSRLGKELIFEKRDAYGDLPEPSEYLLGDNLADRNKQLIKSVKASDSCMSTNIAGGLAYKGKRRSSYEGQGRSTPYNNKFRGNGRFRGRGPRSSSTWGNKPQAPDKRFGRTSEDYAQYGNVPSTSRGGRGRGNQNRGFQK